MFGENIDVERVQSAGCREYRAEAVAVGPVGGGTVRVVLGTFRTPYPGRAVRWLSAQALRVADGLDPDPGVGWLAPEQRGALVTSPELDRLPSAPAALRAWCADEAGRRTAYERLREGRPVVVEAVDHTGAYVLWAVPVEAPIRVRYRRRVPAGGRVA
ncbi:hypothetical protein [Streptomyces sp. NPDC050504]|uniref:hypothetical protein n=1 Tax=Streptomyces sp. NPDC050504 TaxID=3365618 RepID=UPI00379C7D99